MAKKEKWKTAQPAMTESPRLVYQLKVSLRDSPYPIWRVILVDGETDLAELQEIILRSMDGWEFEHLYDLRIGKETYCIFHDDMAFIDGLEADEYRLCDVMGEKGRGLLTYDFGDSWEHQITVMKILPDCTAETPFCIRGKGACPPEDSGGVYGLAYKLQVLADPKHPEYSDIKEWMGDFDPEDFSIERVNARL